MSSFAQHDLLAITRSPGAQYAFITNNNTLHRINAGHADVVQQRFIDDATTFNAYSITKTVTSAAIFRLIAQGKLRLNDEVNTFFPQYSFSDKFTLQQLLSHQSGIGNPMPIKWIHLTSEAFDETSFTHEIISKHLKLSFTPGTKMRYTNVGYMLLGKLIEQVAGVSYRTFVSEQLLKPVTKTGSLSFSLLPDVHSTGYHPKYAFTNLLLTFLLDRRKYMERIPGKWSAFKRIYVNGSPYGGLIANCAGLIDYLQAFMNGEVLSDSLVQQVFATQRDNMSHGWYTGKLGQHSYVCHAGGGGGYYCEIRLYPQLKQGSVVMTNRSGFSDERLLDQIDKHFIS